MSSLTKSSKFMPFSFKDGNLFCESLEIDSLLGELEEERVFWSGGDSGRIAYDVPSTPVYIYSINAIKQNVANYINALQSSGLNGKIGYAIKANPNIHLIEKMQSFGVEMIIAVSGYEVLVALQAGFSPENILLNGNGKQSWEIKLAIEHGVMMNIDSEFDAKQIVGIHSELASEKELHVLLRIRPTKGSNQSNTLKVHEYINTADKSKFGFDLSELDKVLKVLSTRELIKVLGVHCHFGSCIGDPKVYEWLGETLSEMVDELRKRGIHVKILDVGGGIGIDYYETPVGFRETVHSQQETLKQSYQCLTKQLKENYTTPFVGVSEFIKALSTKIPKNIDIILEPGRSLIGKAGILVCKVLGRKLSSGRRLLVVDGSMNEVIRPCLYGAHHHILPVKVNLQEQWEPYDVVGPICESADFLGKSIPMQGSTNYVAIMDCGAYCSSMASNYNLKPRAAEILINIDKWIYIRKRDTFQEIIEKFNPN